MSTQLAGMSNRQIAGWSGVVFVVLLLIGTFVGGVPPSVTDPPQEIIEYFADNEGTLLFANVLNTLAGVFFVLFLVGLYLRVRPVDRGVSDPWTLVGLLGAIFTGVAATIGQAGFSVAILRAEEGTGIVNAFYDLQTMGYTLTGFGIALAVFGFGLALARANLGPPWLMWLSEGVAALGLIGASSAGSSSDVWLLFGFLAFLGFLLWVLVVGTWLAREAAPVAAPPPTTPTTPTV
jgi:hypothetical protein